MSKNLSSQQLAWLSVCRAAVSKEQIAGLLVEMINVGSPTGGERSLAELLERKMAEFQLQSSLQVISDTQANAIGRISGTGEGGSLLLYGHMDTHLAGDEALDAPASARHPSCMSRPQAIRDGDVIFGLGAGNPKGYSAAMIIAAKAIKDANIPLKGEVIVGICSGGMPTNSPKGQSPRNIGHGAGCSFMLQQGIRPDFAIIGKPGDAVAWEEVGVAIFRIRVHGEFGYAGTRHILNYKNPIVAAAKLVTLLEEWLPKYTAHNTSGYVAPQGCIGAIEAGWPHKATFVPAWCDIYVDLRVSPRTDPADVKRQLQSELDRVQALLSDFPIEMEMIVVVPGSRTDERSWIIRSCIEAFEAGTQKPHLPQRNTSGATDAAVLRMWGIPTARFGAPSRVRERTPTLERDLDSVELEELQAYVDRILHVIIDTCTRPLSELRQ